MRLTPETILQADQTLNCIGDRELVLRNLAIPVIENLAVARDGFDTIDLSCNMISILGDGFPPFPRLSALYLGSNRIARVSRGVADSLPNLRILMLTGNRLQNVDDLNLTELSRLTKLEVLSISDNPVANEPQVREKIIKSIPSLKVLNFSKVTLGERKALDDGANTLKPKRKKRKVPSEKLNTIKRKRNDDGDDQQPLEDGNRAKKRKTLTKEQSQAVRDYIEKAESVDQVLRMQEAIRSGTAIEFLKAASKDIQLGT